MSTPANHVDPQNTILLGLTPWIEEVENRGALGQDSAATGPVVGTRSPHGIRLYSHPAVPA